MRLRLVTAGLLLALLAALAWGLRAPHRVLRAWFEYERHPSRASYALAFLVAPQSELRPAAWGPACGPGCIEFDVDVPDPLGLDARLELESGAVVTPRLATGSFTGEERLRFDLTVSRPTDAWLTWKPASLDPGYGLSPPPCGQALSEIGVRPRRLARGRVGVKLTLVPAPDALREHLHGDQPFVP